MFCKADLKIIVAKYNPEGKWDGGGRWFPSANEKSDCCDNIRSPSRAYPKSLWKHCQTTAHIKTRLNTLSKPELIKYQKWVLWFRIVELIQDKHIDRKEMEMLIGEMIPYYDFKKGVTDGFKEALFHKIIDYLI